MHPSLDGPSYRPSFPKNFTFLFQPQPTSCKPPLELCAGIYSSGRLGKEQSLALRRARTRSYGAVGGVGPPSSRTTTTPPLPPLPSLSSTAHLRHITFSVSSCDKHIARAVQRTSNRNQRLEPCKSVHTSDMIDVPSKTWTRA